MARGAEARPALGYAYVRELDRDRVCAAVVDEYAAGADVAVRDGRIEAVQVGERRCGLSRDLYALRLGEVPARVEVFPERSARDVLEVERRARVFSEVEEGDDVFLGFLFRTSSWVKDCGLANMRNPTYRGCPIPLRLSVIGL